MLSVRIERHGPTFCDDVLDDCQHADFFFSNGYVASCYHNEEFMLTEYYHDAIDTKLFDKLPENELWETAGESGLSIKEWSQKQVIDEEMITDILDYYAKDELVEVKEIYYE